ncbi:MAG: hypothetical protein KDG55_13110 [Rhodocyclaceae bacterium]|nr:hypothetical protein [Rhodocyclaceae bacterium]
MLQYKLLRNHAGMLLVGDYETLEALHALIHDVNDRSPIVRDREGLFLGLAYDIRKAYEGQRRKLKAPAQFPEIGPRFGVEILWPVLLVQSRILRASMAFIDTGKWAQAHAYALEAVIEAALKEDFGGDLGARLIQRWMAIHPTHPWAEEKLDSRCAYYCSLGKAERKKRIDGLLASLHPMYQANFAIGIGRGVKNALSPEELDEWDGREWPDPRW